jgi:hypothetical protein
LSAQLLQTAGKNTTKQGKRWMLDLLWKSWPTQLWMG